MATHSSTLAWKIPWTEKPGRLQSMGSRRVRHLLSDFTFTFMHWRRKWQPIPVFLPGESQGQQSLVGCHLWGHKESNTTEATQQQHAKITSALIYTLLLFIPKEHYFYPELALFYSVILLYTVLSHTHSCSCSLTCFFLVKERKLLQIGQEDENTTLFHSKSNFLRGHIPQVFKVSFWLLVQKQQSSLCHKLSYIFSQSNLNYW